MSNIVICGDILPTEINMQEFESGSTDHILSDQLWKLLNGADYRIANLEGCFLDGGKPIIKSGPNLKASQKAFIGFKQLGFDMVGLANNHIMDYGTEGLSTTLALLEEANIGWCGAGKSISDAYKAHIFKLGKKKVGVIALAEYEFTIATEKRPGAACFDDLESPDFIASTKKETDYLVVLYHGGKEYYRYPTPYVQKRCRKLVDKGADLVITQHSHCIGCKEDYHGGTIVYGQGNFLLTRGEDNDFRRTGLILQIDIEERAVGFQPVIVDGQGVRLTNEEETSAVLSDFHARSSQIQQDGFVEESYRAFADEKLKGYQIQSMGRVAAILEKFHALGNVQKLYDRQNMVNLLNTLRCEAHRDLYIQGLLNRLGLSDQYEP